MVSPEPSIPVIRPSGCAPLGLLSLAGYLQKYGVTVKIIDGAIGKNVWKEIFSFQPNIVGVTATTPEIPNAYRLLDVLRLNRPDIYTVIGGVHVSVLLHEALEHVDSVIVGEGETALLDVVKSLEAGVAKKGIIQGQPIENIDEIPNAFNLIDFNSCYLDTQLSPKLCLPCVGLITSRGCRYRCSFCYNSSRPTNPRYLSAKRVVEDITYFVEKYKVKSVFFYDDEFIVNKKRLFEIAKLFDETGINHKITWGCLARVNSLDIDTLKLMKSMGCVVIRSGFESPNPRLLRYLKNKTITVEQNERPLPLAHKLGITMGGSFIFGSPTGLDVDGKEDNKSETLVEMKQVLDWFSKQDTLKFMDNNTLVLYPGTKIWDYAKSHGYNLPSEKDYSLLADKLLTDEKLFVDKSVSLKSYTRFFKDLEKIVWVIKEIRDVPSSRTLLRLIRTNTFWEATINHPSIVLGLVKKTFNGTLREIS